MPTTGSLPSLANSGSSRAVQAADETARSRSRQAAPIRLVDAARRVHKDNVIERQNSNLLAHGRRPSTIVDASASPEDLRAKLQAIGYSVEIEKKTTLDSA